MIPVFQTKFGGEDASEEDQGNCMAACLASIFEVGLDDVPDFTGSIMSGGWYFYLERWLKNRNLSVLMLPGKPQHVPAGYAMACVNSETLPAPIEHMVVVLNGWLAHDPNPNAKRKPDDYDVKEYWAFTVMDASIPFVGLEVQDGGIEDDVCAWPGAGAD